MSATVEIDEQNGSAPGSTTHNIADSDMSTEDSPTTDPVGNPVTPGNNTMEKFQKIDVTNMGGSSLIDNLKIWRTSALGGSAVHLTNARETSYAGAATYTTPTVSDSALAIVTMPTSEPSGSNLGIGGSLSGSLAAPGQSDHLVHQIQTDVGDTEGSTSTMNYQFDETA